MCSTQIGEKGEAKIEKNVRDFTCAFFLKKGEVQVQKKISIFRCSKRFWDGKEEARVPKERILCTSCEETLGRKKGEKK